MLIWFGVSNAEYFISSYSKIIKKLFKSGFLGHHNKPDATDSRIYSTPFRASVANNWY
jgi:hypothetical protein